MQVRHYLTLLLRFWPLILLLPLLAGGLSLALALTRPPVYQVSTQMLMTLIPRPAPASPLPDFDFGSTWLTTEYILDDLPAVIASVAFAEDVRALLPEAQQGLDQAAIRSGLRIEVSHRSVWLNATAGDPATAEALAAAAVSALRQGGLKYWGRTPPGGLELAVLDPPGPAVAANSSSAIIREVGLRAGLALAAAVGIAFLVAYFDDRLRSVGQAEAWIGARVIAVIPEE